jgi:hypothetical protein
MQRQRRYFYICCAQKMAQYIIRGCMRAGSSDPAEAVQCRGYFGWERSKGNFEVSWMLLLLLGRPWTKNLNNLHSSTSVVMESGGAACRANEKAGVQPPGEHSDKIQPRYTNAL